MGENFTRLVKKYIEAHGKRRCVLAALFALSACTVLGVYGALMSPAVSQENANPALSAKPANAVFEDTLTAWVTATAESGQTAFCLIPRAENAAPDESVAFDAGGKAVVVAKDGTKVTLRRASDKDGAPYYCFELEEGQSVTFALPYVFGPGAAAKEAVLETAAPSVQATPSESAQTSAWEQIAATEETPAAEATPAAAETPVPEATPATEGTPAAEATPAAAGTPVPEATPAAAETPVPEATPTAAETPATAEASATPETTPVPAANAGRVAFYAGAGASASEARSAARAQEKDGEPALTLRWMSEAELAALPVEEDEESALLSELALEEESLLALESFDGFTAYAQSVADQYSATTVTHSNMYANPGAYVIYTQVGSSYYAVTGSGGLAEVSVSGTTVSWPADDAHANIFWTFSDYRRPGNYLSMQMYNAGTARYLVPQSSGSAILQNGAGNVRLNYSANATSSTIRNNEYARFLYRNPSNTLISNASSTVFYFARQNTRTIVFDGTNGGVAYYTGASKTSQTVYGQYVALPTSAGTTTNYGYRLNGWYDITNNLWYAPGATATVAGDTVFYADWVASSYNMGLAAGAIASADTGDFITTRVFDYNDLFNIESLTKSSNSTRSEVWSLVASGNADTGRPTRNFVFFDTAHASGTGYISNPNGRNYNNGNHQANNGAAYYDGIVSPGILTSALRAALFEPESDTLGKTYVGTDSRLYQYDAATGFYYYDSTKNAAAYNQSAQRFYVYGYRVMTSKSAGSGEDQSDFLPFNYGTSGRQFNAGDGSTNYFFGMSTQIEFFLPRNSGEKDASGKYYNRSVKGDNLVFKFCGDDDVWIFVDGQLVLDLGGIHDVVYGEIDFAAGTVTIGQSGARIDTSQICGIGVAKNADNTTSMQFASGEHVVSVYYLERGASQSNASIYFNLAPRYSLRINKEDVENSNITPNGAEFSFYMDEACTVPARLWTSESAKKQGAAATNVFTVAGGEAVCWGFAPGVPYYIKETGTPDGYEQSEARITLSLDRGAGVSVAGHDEAWSFVADYQQEDASQEISFTVNNKLMEDPKITLVVRKEWSDGNSAHSGGSVAFDLIREGTDGSRAIVRNDVVLNAANNWQASFEGLIAADVARGVTYSYSVVETRGPEGYDVSYELSADGDTRTAVIRNTLHREISIRKEWLNFDGTPRTQDIPASVTGTLFRRYTLHTPGGPDTVVAESVAEFTLSAENGWTQTWAINELGERSGVTYAYFVEENPVEGYGTTYLFSEVADNTPDTPILIRNQYQSVPYELPETGGPGTRGFTAGGAALLLAALVMLRLRKRRKEDTS